MMLSQIRQKKKKEAVRRLSQGPSKVKKTSPGFTDNPNRSTSLREPSNVPAGSVFGGTTFRQPVFGSAQPAPTTPVLGNSGEVFGSRQTDTFGAGLEKGNFNLKSSQETQGKGVFGFNISTASTEIPRSTFTQASSVQRLFGTSQDDAGVGVFSGSAPGNFSATFTPISTTSSVFGASSSKGRSFSFGQPKEIKQAAPFGFPITPTIESSKEHNVFGAATVSRGPSVFGANPFGKSTPSLKRTSPHNKSGNQQTSPTTDISALKGLVIREIPEAFNKNPWLKRFYSRFGEVAKIICYPGKKSASVIFKTHAAAEQAKRKGTVLLPGTAPVSIFWKQDKKRSRTGRTSDQSNVASEEGKQMVTKGLMVKAKDSSGEQTEILKDSDLSSLPTALSAGDRFRILDMIDKKIRQGVKKATDISTAKAVKGACPDMCPEKERYMREDRRRLHVFETVPGSYSMEENPKVNHSKAIKEYDRSAADKDEPLPHELRPIPVLKMTMDYLVTNVMDIGEGRWAEWFDFVWNRTRGIRKDITQQHLCDVDAVELIEKTARFHIFCAHYLCGEDMMTFDSRINTENLTKCLQTLKQFYGDLQKNQGVTCPHEAEFRAYDILLNLNEGDILRQAMKYREEIQRSPIVKFATSVFHALDSNNFVRFFKLVKCADYMCACILHRYFTQVRSMALRTMNYSLTTPNKEMYYPLEELAQVLAFEDADEASDFCTFFGLDVAESSVIFMRGSFVEPVNKYPMRRTQRLIESKRNYSIGQAVHNGPLPTPPTHEPVLSFDEKGNYTGSYHMTTQATHESTAETDNKLAPESLPCVPVDSGSAMLAQPEPGFAAVPMPRAEEPDLQSAEQHQYSQQALTEEVKFLAKGLFVEVIKEMFYDIAEELMEKVHASLAYSNELSETIVDEGVAEFSSEIAENLLLDERRNQLLAAHEAALKQKLIGEVHAELLDEVVTLETLRVAMETYGIEQEEQYKRCQEQVVQQLCQDFLKETVREEVAILTKESYREKKADRKSSLQKICHQVMNIRMKRYFKRWLKCYHSLIHIKHLLREFPAHPPLTTPQQQLAHLTGTRGTVSEGPPVRIDGNENCTSELLAKRQAELSRLRADVIRPLDIPQLIEDAKANQHALRPGPFRNSEDWKLVVSFAVPCQPFNPNSISSSKVCVDGALIREKLRRGTLPGVDGIPASLQGKVEVLSLYRGEVSRQSSRRHQVCIKAYHGTPSHADSTELMTSRQLQGACAIAVVFTSDDLDSSNRIQELRMSISRLLQSKPVLPAIPVLLLMVENTAIKNMISDDSISAMLGKDELVASGLVTRIRIHRVPRVTDFHNMDHVLQGGLSWLIQHSLSLFDIKQDSLKNFTEEGLQKYFFSSLYDDIAMRKKAGLGEQCPEPVVSLYNATVNHLAAVVSSPGLGHVSWPAPEFTADHSADSPSLEWNSPSHLATLRDYVTDLMLPDPPPGADDGTWESECALCLEYVKTIPSCTCGLVMRIRNILNRKLRSMQAIDFLSSSRQLSASEVPWTQVIEACISTVVTLLHSNPVLSETSVFYLPTELALFEQPLDWRDCVGSSKQDRCKELYKSSLQTASPAKRESMLHQSVMSVDQEMHSICEKSLVSALSPVLTIPQEDHGSLHDLQQRLSAVLWHERQESNNFEHMLQCLVGEESVTDSVTQYLTQSKKRKAESLIEFQGTKSSRHRTDGLISGLPDRRHETIETRLSQLQESIRDEREFTRAMEERMASYLKS